MKEAQGKREGRISLGHRGVTHRYKFQRHLVPATAEKQVTLALDVLCKNRPVVIKRYSLPRHLAQDPIQLLRICDGYLSLSHPGLAKPLNVLVSDVRQSLHFVTEYVSGEPYLPAAKSLPNDAFMKIVGQLCSVLQYLHTRGYAHLDLHPGNVLLVPPTSLNTSWQVKLIDLPPFPLTTLSTWRELVAFHPGFSAPEVFAGTDFDHRADIFSLGALLYGALVGEPPPLPAEASESGWSQESEARARTELISPSFLAPIVRKLLEPLADRRFSSCYFVLEDINNQLKDQRLSLDSSESVEEMIHNIPLVSTNSFARMLAPVQEWLKRATPPDSLKVEVTGLPGSGKKKVAEALSLFLKFQGMRVLRFHRGSSGESKLLLSCSESVESPTLGWDHGDDRVWTGTVMFFEAPLGVPRVVNPTFSTSGTSPVVSIQVRQTGFASVSDATADSGHPNSIRLTISPLDRGESASFIDVALHPNYLPGHLKDELAARSLGLPGVIQSFLLELVRSEVVMRKGVAWEMRPGDSSSIAMPGTVIQLLGPALDTLNPSELKILELLALTHHPIEVPEVCLVLDTLDGSTVEVAVSRLKQAGLIEENSGQIWVPSQTVLDLVKGRCDRQARERLAKCALKVLGERATGRPGEVDALLAGYATTANDRASTIHHASRAAEYFESTNRFTDALRAYQTVLETLDLRMRKRDCIS